MINRRPGQDRERKGEKGGVGAEEEGEKGTNLLTATKEYETCKEAIRILEVRGAMHDPIDWSQSKVRNKKRASPCTFVGIQVLMREDVFSLNVPTIEIQLIGGGIVIEKYRDEKSPLINEHTEKHQWVSTTISLHANFHEFTSLFLQSNSFLSQSRFRDLISHLLLLTPINTQLPLYVLCADLARTGVDDNKYVKKIGDILDYQSWYSKDSDHYPYDPIWYYEVRFHVQKGRKEGIQIEVEY